MSKASKVLAIIFGILMVIGGISCMFTPVVTTLAIGYIVGFSMIFDAIGRFMEWFDLRKTQEADGFMLAGAILSMIFGFFILNSAILQLGIDAFIVYYIAIWLILHGIITVLHALKLHKFHKNWDTKILGTRWYLPLIFGILVVIFGIICLFNPLIIASMIGVFIGLGIISAGATMITAGASPSDNQ